MFDTSAIKTKGKKFQYGHDKTGRQIKVTLQDGKEVKREFTGKRIIFPGGLGTNRREGNIGVIDLGIKEYKRQHPNASHDEIAACKQGAWAFPPAQMNIEMTAMPEEGKKK